MWTDVDDDVAPRPQPRIYHRAPRVVADAGAPVGQSKQTVRGVTHWLAGFTLSIILLLYVSGYL